jgi:hypothetical protein
VRFSIQIKFLIEKLKINEVVGLDNYYEWLLDILVDKPFDGNEIWCAIPEIGFNEINALKPLEVFANINIPKTRASLKRKVQSVTPESLECNPDEQNRCEQFANSSGSNEVHDDRNPVNIVSPETSPTTDIKRRKKNTSHNNNSPSKWFANGNLVPNNAVVRKQGRLYFASVDGNSEERIFSKSTLIDRQQFFDESGNAIPKSSIISTEGSSYFSTIEGKKIEVYRKSTLDTKLKYVFKNGEYVPKSTKIRSDGKSYYVIINGSEKVEVISKRNYVKNKFKFYNGTNVPHDAVIREQNGQYYTKKSGGKEVEVFKSFKLSRIKLKLESGETLPQGAVTYKKDGKFYYTKSKGAEKIEVFTSNELSARRLKFFDGTLVPKDCVTFKKDKLNYARTDVDGNAVITQIYRADDLSNIKSQMKKHPQKSKTSITCKFNPEQLPDDLTDFCHLPELSDRLSNQPSKPQGKNSAHLANSLFNTYGVDNNESLDENYAAWDGLTIPPA